MPYDNKLCPNCGGYAGRDLYEIDQLFVCVRCFREWLKDYARSNPSEVARQLSVPVIAASELEVKQ